MRLTERFTRTAADVITYEVRIEDPKTYVRPFTITLPLTAASGAGVLPSEGGACGGQSIFGGQGPRAFTATRVQ